MKKKVLSAFFAEAPQSILFSCSHKENILPNIPLINEIIRDEPFSGYCLLQPEEEGELERIIINF